jgi:hypothetical protein
MTKDNQTIMLPAMLLVKLASIRQPEPLSGQMVRLSIGRGGFTAPAGRTALAKLIARNGCRPRKAVSPFLSPTLAGQAGEMPATEKTSGRSPVRRASGCAGRWSVPGSWVSQYKHFHCHTRSEQQFSSHLAESQSSAADHP